MSHSVTVTRTTTTTTTSAILINTGYFKAVPGLLKLGQVILGTIIIGLVATTLSRYNNYYYSGSEELFFFVTACACLIATGCLLISCLLSISTASIISKTIFLLMLLVPLTLMYLIAATLVLVTVVARNYGHKIYEDEFSTRIHAAILGLFNTILYLASTILAFKSYRGG
ncbi:uncharacterized protein LOC132192972 isoform X1 [Neocloeon triangulifer]|uniref:uncharacterized protein LOC132192972 isoform X1 n=1 Tax=Neocloeon triangulifer TaxID=2078957 RepID=UPI00286EBCE2|nr:uncharacterized protein LOC132192972 isoform X1 [Neocloeon triangulifer]XP_059469214.1 uncharacterized protein LOC132192972 isoform X1 [Neocloeon triangulifer]XP_059469215.1 uncharacterized protein LOC132192972 isoform X1 [Neocloeon triangulifer]XP_059469216.1 uncharacterized protein LOC132192972 isoform X1 [Neocloeon triangulifer]